MQLDVFPGRGHGFGEDQALLVRRAAEFCAEALGANSPVPVNVRPVGWIYWLPVALLGVVVWGGFRLGNPNRSSRRESAPTLLRFKWSGLTSAATSRWLRWSAAIMATAAVLVSAAHLALPLLRVNETTAKLARAWNVRPELRADFDWLVSQPGAAGCRLRELLDHLNLASLQRGQFAGELPENDWREFVLSPWIEGAGEDIGWRRELWETLYPRIRRETDAGAAAQIIARELRRRILVEPASAEASIHDSIHEAWGSGVAGLVQREQLLNAMLRSTGIPARIATTGACEFMDNGQWIPVPRTFLP